MVTDIKNIYASDIWAKGFCISELKEKIIDYCIRVATGEIIPKAAQL
jgi:hypothetical protein